MRLQDLYHQPTRGPYLQTQEAQEAALVAVGFSSPTGFMYQAGTCMGTEERHCPCLKALCMYFTGLLLGTVKKVLRRCRLLSHTCNRALQALHGMRVLLSIPRESTASELRNMP